MSLGILAVIKNIGILADDTSTMVGVAGKNTMGILGDDLAVNAEKASGFSASRELPVLWAITKGSLLNKLIIVPIMMLLSAFLPGLITPILILGGVYLSYEGAEKIDEYLNPEKHKDTNLEELKDPSKDILEVEKSKIKSAIFTDFILSIEIVLITLGSVLDQSLDIQIIVVSFISLLATVGVYGMVGLIVRLDDLGYWFIKKSITSIKNIEAKYKLEAGEIFNYKSNEIIHINTFFMAFGNFLIISMGKIIKSLGYIGTAAMLLVAGGIFVHNIGILHHFLYGHPWFISLPLDFLIALIIGYFVFLLENKIKTIKKFS